MHDLLTRSREHMESIESALKLIEKESRLEEVKKTIEDYKAKVPDDFYNKLKNLLDL